MEFVSPIEGPYIFCQGKKWLDFSSCDFLGLAQHPEVRKATIKQILKYGIGMPTKPLGSLPQQQVEMKLAQFLGTESVLFFPSLESVHQAVKNLKGSMISSDTGETRPKKAQAPVCIDESFTIGITGHRGFGLAAHQNDYDLICGSLANGVGCSGAYLAGAKKWLDSLTLPEPLSFATLGALDSAFSFIPEMTQEREIIEKHSLWLQKQLSEFPIKKMKSPRVILEFKSEKEAEQTRVLFGEDQIYLAPTIDNTLYIGMTALHTPDDLDQLATTLKKFSATDLALSMQSLTPTP